MKKQNATKRKLFAELVEGVGAMKAPSRGEGHTPHAYCGRSPRSSCLPGRNSSLLLVNSFNVSRAVWANMLRISPRTVEKCEEGGQVSPIAATFVELVTQFPDTIERLQTLPRRVSRPSRRMRVANAGRNSASPSAGQTGKRASSLKRSAKVG